MGHERLLCHAATVAVDAPAEKALAFMADGIKLGTWAMGCWSTRRVGPGLFAGRSLFDGGEGFVRIVVDRKLMNVDYLVGPSPGQLCHQNSARVIPGADVARNLETCLVTLLAWRPGDMSDADWRRICLTHEAEMLLIQSWLGGGGRAGAGGPAPRRRRSRAARPR